jgi:hypothetical protein
MKNSIVLLAGMLFSLSGLAAGKWPPPLPSGAVHYYVSVSGSDSNSGSSSSPWLTINHASNAISAGSQPVVIHVAPGNYNLTSSTCIKTTVSGSSAAPITFISDQRWGAKVIGSSGCLHQWYVTGNYINIWGFDFTGIQTSSNLDSTIIDSEGGVGHVDIGYNYIHNLPYGFGASIIMEPWGNGNYSGAPCSVHDNVIHDIAYNSGATFNNYGMYIACGANSYVYNNLIYNQGSIGIHLWHAANKVYIYNNTISSNNSISNDSSIGILVGTGDGGAVSGAYFNVSNNIVVNSHYGIMAESGSGASISTSSVFQNNLIYNNAIDWYYNKSGSTGTLQAGGFSVTGVVKANPLFVSASSGDYHLSSGSPAIDSGISSGAPATDLELNARPNGTAVDRGAYEFGSGAAPAITLSATSFNFGNVVVGTSSATQTLTIKNSGTASLSFTSDFVISSGFSGSGNCSTSTPLAPGASCYLNIVYKPTVVGASSGSVTIATNASGSPAVVSLSGTGVSSSGPAVKLSATSLNFGTVAVGTTSAAQTVTITNSGSASLSFTKSFVISSQFLAAGTSCSLSTPLAPGASCSLSIKFKPTSTGVKTGSVQIYSNASSSPNVISLTGTGK